MRTETVTVPLRDGNMSAYLAYPDKTPAGAIIAIMEIWGVNHTMREHAREFAEAGYICLVPDLFWRQEPGIEMTSSDPKNWFRALDLYYNFNYDLGVRDMEDTMNYLRKIAGGNGKVGSVGYCLGGKMCYLMCCRTDIDCAVAYYGTYIEHSIREAPNLHRPFLLHQAMADKWVPTAVCEYIGIKLSSNPLVEIERYPNADHAFARHGEPTYTEADANRALDLSLQFFGRYLKS